MAKCEDCSGHCCKYITVQINEPKKDIDFEELKWFLNHENVTVYIDHDDDWCVEFRTPCKFQDPANKCTIYEKRPKVCQEHLIEECEGNEDYGDYHKRIFMTMDDIDKYKEEISEKKTDSSEE